MSEDEAATLRPDYQSSPDDNVIIQAMEGSASALGFTGFAYAEGAADQIKEIQVDEGSGCVEPTRDTIADGSYPLSRTLYIYVNTEKITSNPALKAFVDLYVSDDGLVSAVQQARIRRTSRRPDRRHAARRGNRLRPRLQSTERRR